MENSRRSTEEPAKQQESEPDNLYSHDHTHNLHKSSKKTRYQNIPNKNPYKNSHHIFKAR